jgi:hypothetical protein
LSQKKEKKTKGFHRKIVVYAVGINPTPENVAKDEIQRIRC